MGRSPLESASTPLRGMECEQCGMGVDSDAPSCPECGTARPDAGWQPFNPRAAAHRRETVDLSDAPGDAPPGARHPAPARILVGPPLDAAGAAGDLEREAPVEIMYAALEAEDVGARDLAPGSSYAGRYRIEECLGSASGANRHIAVQEPLVRRVVLTVLLPDQPQDVQEALEDRFLRDANALRRLRHPCLAPVHDAGRAADRTCFYTEELLYGPSLADLSARGPLPPERALGVVADVAAALSASHERGVPHRCLRADSLVITHWGWRGRGREVAQVGRFGVEVTPESVLAEQDPESLVCWPPEVLAGEEPGEGADIYAVGALLYRALAGQAPYLGGPDEVRVARAAGDPAPLVRPGDGWIGDALCAVAERCLRAEPAARYPSMRALLVVLEDLADLPAPVRAVGPPVAAPARLPPWRLLVAAGLAGAVGPTAALLLLGLASGWPSPRLATAPDLGSAASRPASIVSSGAAPAAAAMVPSAPAPVPAAATALAAAPAAVTPAAATPAAASRIEAAPAAPAPSARTREATTPADRSSPAPRAGATPAAATLASTSATPASPWSAAPAAASEVPTSPAIVQVSSRSAPASAATTAPPATASAGRPAGVVLPGASDLSGLWVGRAGRSSFALDLSVSPDGRVTGRLRSEGAAADAALVGRVTRSDGGLLLELQATEGEVTTTYSGAVADGELRGRIYAGGKAQARFSAVR